MTDYPVEHMSELHRRDQSRPAKVESLLRVSRDMSTITHMHICVVNCLADNRNLGDEGYNRAFLEGM